MMALTPRPPPVRTSRLEEEPTEVDHQRRRSLREELRARLVAAIQVKRLDIEQVSIRTGLHERTVARLLRGETMDLRTLEQVADALRVDLMEERKVEVVEDSRSTSSGQERPTSAKMGQVCVTGWEQAAAVLGIPVRTLRRKRIELRCTRVWPWWPDQAACREWFDGLVQGEKP